MKFELPKIYPITDTRISGLSHEEQVTRLIAGGAKLIQLRDKQASPAAFHDAALAAVSVSRRHNVKVLINDRVDIALAVGADGVHLGQDDLPPDAARTILGPNAIIGFSTHTIEQVAASIMLPVDYIAFGPIFDTRTKHRPDPVVGLASLVTVRELAEGKLIVAIGGIDPTNYESVLAAGADSVAVISSLLSDPNRITQRLVSMSRGNNIVQR